MAAMVLTKPRSATRAPDPPPPQQRSKETTGRAAAILSIIRWKARLVAIGRLSSCVT